MRYRWIDDIDDFCRISPEWDEALVKSREDNPFLLSDFIICWWKYLGKGKSLRVLAMYEGDTLAAGIPLCRSTSGRLEHIGGIMANYTEFLMTGTEREIWDTFLRALDEVRDWRRLVLRRYRTSKLPAAVIKDALIRHVGTLSDMRVSDRAYRIRIPEDFSGYIDRLPKKLRYYLKRSETELQKLGTVNLCTVKEHDEAVRVVDDYIELSRRSFKERNRKSAFEDSKKCMFLKELVSRFSHKGILDMNVLKLDNRTIAVHIGYSLGRNLNYIFPVFDIEFARLNPGHLLIYKLLELGAGRGSKFFDFYTGYQFYKEQWSDSTEGVFTIDIRPNDLRGRVGHFMSARSADMNLKEKVRKVIHEFV